MAIEQNLALQGVLTAKGYGEIVQYGDFLEHNGEYDRIILNPPFERCTDQEHIRKAYDLLGAGGRVVAIASEHGFFAQDKRSEEFRRWLETRR
jgi:16S rRNA G1207 methylase RsmC